MPESFEIKGLRELEKKLKTFEPKVSKGIVRKALRNAMKPMLLAVKENVPVDTGALRDAIKIQATKGGRDRIVIAVRMNKGGDDKEFIGGFLEYGTSHQAPQGFLRKAWDETRDQSMKIALDQIQAGIAKLTS